MLQKRKILVIQEEWRRVEMENDMQANLFFQNTFKPLILDDVYFMNWFDQFVHYPEKIRNVALSKLLISEISSSINKLTSTTDEKAKLILNSFIDNYELEKEKDYISHIVQGLESMELLMSIESVIQDLQSIKTPENKFDLQILAFIHESISNYHELIFAIPLEAIKIADILIATNSSDYDRYVSYFGDRERHLDKKAVKWKDLHEFMLILGKWKETTPVEESERLGWERLPKISFHKKKDGYLWKYRNIEKKANKRTFPGLIGQYINANPECVKLGIRLDELEAFRKKTTVPKEIIKKPTQNEKEQMLDLKKKVLDLNKSFRKVFYAPDETFMQHQVPSEGKGVFLTFTNPKRWQK